MSRASRKAMRPGEFRSNRDLQTALEENGFILCRAGNHFVYRLGSHTLSVSKTPSDPRSVMNTARLMRRIVAAYQAETDSAPASLEAI